MQKADPEFVLRDVDPGHSLLGFGVRKLKSRLADRWAGTVQLDDWLYLLWPSGGRH